MKIIEQIKWNKLRRYVWDEELNQTSGEIIYNYPENNYIFVKNKCGFDSKQLIKIAELLEELNNALHVEGEE